MEGNDCHCTHLADAGKRSESSSSYYYYCYFNYCYYNLILIISSIIVIDVIAIIIIIQRGPHQCMQYDAVKLSAACRLHGSAFAYNAEPGCRWIVRIRGLQLLLHERSVSKLPTVGLDGSEEAPHKK